MTLAIVNRCWGGLLDNSSLKIYSQQRKVGDKLG